MAHPITLSSKHYLASAYYRQGRWKEAEELEKQVIEFYKKAVGMEHSNTLIISMSNLAVIYVEQGRWKEAEELIMQVLESLKNALGMKYPATLSCMRKLAFIWKKLGQDTMAIDLMAGQ